MYLLKIVDSASSDLHALISKLDAELLERYPAEEVFGVDFQDPYVNQILFVVAYDGDKPVGCGAIRPLDQETTELKRMFVDLPYRQKGVASAILRFLEEQALERSFTAVRLETGAPQYESIHLYTKRGYQPIDRYGEYANNESSLCYEKILS